MQDTPHKPTFPALRRAPIWPRSAVMHVGTLNPADKQTDSHEGNGLSVSIHPDEWTRIAKLGGGSTWRLSKTAGRFLDFYKVSNPALKELQAWGVHAGWLNLVTRFEGSWLDGETDDIRFTYFETEERARDELEGELEENPETTKIKQVLVPELTAAAFERLGFRLSEGHALDIAATFWVEDETELDGVWWHDELDQFGGSAPCGVINLKSLPAWQTTLVTPPRLR